MDEDILQFLVKEFKQRWDGMHRAWMLNSIESAVQNGKEHFKNKSAGDGGIFDFDDSLKSEMEQNSEEEERRRLALYVRRCIKKRPLTGPDGKRYILGRCFHREDIFIDAPAGSYAGDAISDHAGYEKQRREGSLGVRFLDQRILNKKPSDRTPEDWKSFL